MAALVGTFTPVRAWRYGGPEGKSQLKVEGTLVVTTAGGTNAAEILASLFGLNQFIGSSSFTKSDNTTVLYGNPEYVNGQSLLIGGAAANATQDLPTGTYKAHVQGLSA